MGIVVFLLFVPLTVAAWTVFFLCWHGRQTPQPPVCAKCGHATGDRPGVHVATCPECGSGLLDPRAVRYFKRERTTLMRAGLVVSSLLLFIFGIFPLAALMALLIGLGPRLFRTAPPPAAAPGAPPVQVAPSDEFDHAHDETEEAPVAGGAR